jgi:predicted SnoaL-like aldol condensation-catalyzing enzyme
MFHNINKSENFVPGFICVLHTFGRPLEWNPHIHCLIFEGGLSDNGFWRSVKHFNYTLLRKSFQTALLNLLQSRLGSSFKKTKALIYRRDKHGFYIYAKPSLSDTNTVIKYVSRYLGRPVIALKRIDSYDGDSVTFHYNRYEDNTYVQKTLPVLDFMRLLIQHIPEKHYKTTRYYGLYSRHRGKNQSLYKAIPKSKHQIIRSFTKWRSDILLSFGYDSLKCPRCEHEMLFVELYYDHHRVSLKELYERTMAKFKCHSASFFHLSASYLIYQQTGGLKLMDSKLIEELRQKYINNPPEGMTAKLVRNMTDSDLLDMHYFLIEDDDLDDDEFEEGFYIF